MLRLVLRKRYSTVVLTANDNWVFVSETRQLAVVRKQLLEALQKFSSVSLHAVAGKFIIAARMFSRSSLSLRLKPDCCLS